MKQIERAEFVMRHNIRKIGRDKCFPIGNGEFCFSADFTGLQTFRGNSMSHWGWHSFPVPEGVDAANIPETGCYMKEMPKDGVDRVPVDKQQEVKYVFCNPHPLNLARVRFIKSNGAELAEEDFIQTSFLLNLYDGFAKTSFLYSGSSVTVTIFAVTKRDGIVACIETEKEKCDLAVEISFPYPALENGRWIGNFNVDDCHHTTFAITENHKTCLAERSVDSTRYTVSCECKEGSFIQSGIHSLRLNLSKKGSTEFSVLFFDEGNASEKLKQSFKNSRQQTALHWHDFWNNGGAIDLSESRDERWFELERRIVLSQYLLAVQSAGSYPCAEAGLMNLDSWYGQFHMEMTWWHIAHYALWNRMEMADKQLSCYRKFLPVAEKLAKQLGSKGAKWGKQVGPEGRTAPWDENLSLHWKQPHPIFFAELEYLNRPNEQTLNKWDEIIYKTAEHMIRKIYASGLPHRAIAVYLYLSDRANKDGTCYPSIKTISKELNFSVSTVKRAIEDLVVSGYVEKKQRWREKVGNSSLTF